MNLTPRRQALRAVFSGNQCIYPASVSDPLSARAAESLGFESMMFAGSIASLTVLGAPDIIVLTLSEFAAQANRICRASDKPLIVDADHGYGNAMNVKRTVEELETAGVSCLTIEDTLLPRRFGSEKSEFLSIAEGRGKMKAALAGRQDNDLVILGRTSSIDQHGVDEAIRRASEYLEAGVDGIMFVGVKTRADLEAISKSIDAPIMIGGASAELQDIKYLSDCGVRISLQGHQPYMAAVEAMYQSLKALREGVAPADLEGVASPELMKKLSRQEDYDFWQKDYLN
ncbi:MAG: carboxyvinyl-carboxyphosphonate phosphorylmutase [Gammaproteobacteria bacterium]|jgi:carboxyvinyl-carboxyphosphonate phosphorylmutase